MRYLILALDSAGAGLLAGGLCLLAWLAHPYLALVAAGACALTAGFLIERRSRGE